jgi:hypothetical protein
MCWKGHVSIYRGREITASTCFAVAAKVGSELKWSRDSTRLELLECVARVMPQPRILILHDSLREGGNGRSVGNTDVVFRQSARRKYPARQPWELAE